MSSQLERFEAVIDGGALETIVTGLRGPGYVVLHDALPEPVLTELLATFDDVNDEFARAGIGRDDRLQQLDTVRRDRIHWLDADREVTAWYFRWVESLRLGLNRALFLGLFDYECHLAWYPPGAFYKTHVDAFRGDDNRKVSTVLYLNPQWEPGDGGELVIYEAIGEPEDAVTASADSGTAGPVEVIVTPTFGTMVLFLSEEFPHEVTTADADRHSLAGWFRVNANPSSVPEPPVFAPG